MPTVKELADELGVTPQTIRRYVKNELHVATTERKTLQLDATQAAIVADHFKSRRKQVKSKPIEDEAKKLIDEIATMKVEVATLRERVSGLERENDLLREQLKVSNEALEREQLKRVGFLSRIGQRLLGSGEK